VTDCASALRNRYLCIMKFERYRIADEIKRSLAAQGFKKPTDIQYRAIPNILAGEDLLAIAQTGTGKTAAFVIPILEMISKENRRSRSAGIKCIVMVPTRELAVQITKVFKTIGQHLNVETYAVHGGVDQDPQIAKLEEGIDVMVATPGRMFDLVSQGHIKLHRVQTVVLDEADHMLDLGFIADIENLIRWLPKRRQTLFFSATINDTIKKIAYSLVNKPVRIQISPKDPVSKNVTHSVIHVDMDTKRYYLEKLINENVDKKVLVFVRTKVRAERVQKAMARVNIEALTMHGDKSQSDRLRILDSFSKGEVMVLIATDVSARGIDIPGVELVVNYDLPEYTENYVHRVGRTGRGRNKGLAFSFCSEQEQKLLKEIQGFLGKEIVELQIAHDAKEDILSLSEEKPITMDSIEKNLEEIVQGKRTKRKAKERNKNKK